MRDLSILSIQCATGSLEPLLGLVTEEVVVGAEYLRLPEKTTSMDTLSKARMKLGL